VREALLESVIKFRPKNARIAFIVSLNSTYV